MPHCARPHRVRLGRTRVLAAVTAVCLVAPAADAGPRLFFDAAEVDALRAKAQTAPFNGITSAIASSLNPSLTATTSAFTGKQYDYSFEAGNAASMYLLTGNDSYAVRVRDMTLALTADTEYWSVNSSKSLTRAVMARNVAMAYDFCKDAPSWQANRAATSLKLKQMADSLSPTKGSGGSGWPGDSRPGNNWFGVRFSAAGLAYLACDETKSTFQVDLDATYFKTGSNLNVLQHLKFLETNNNPVQPNNNGTNPPAFVTNSNGWNPEGTGYVQYPQQFIVPYSVAMKRLENKDLFADAPPEANNMIQRTFIGAVAISRPETISWNGSTQTLIRKGVHADFTDDHTTFSGRGTSGLALKVTDPVLLPGLKYMYDQLSGTQGDGSWDSNDAGGIYSLLYYPSTTTAVDPSKVPGWGRTFVDPAFGMTIYRNAYAGQNDIVAHLNAKGRRPSGTHGGPDMNGFRLIGLNSIWATGAGRTGDPRGQTTVFPADPNGLTSTNTNANVGVLVNAYTRTPGDGYSVTTSTNPAVVSSSGTSAPTYLSSTLVYNHTRRMVVDYSKTSGAAGLFVIGDTSNADPTLGTGLGRYWRMNTPEFNSVTLGPAGSGRFTLTSPDGNLLYGQVLWGDKTTLRVGTFARDNPTDPNSLGVAYGNTVYLNNNWIDFQSTDGQFLVALYLAPAGSGVPTFTTTGTGINQTISIGNQQIALSGTTATAWSWAEWTAAGSGNWATGANWRDGTSPSGAGRTANFIAPGTAGRTVNVTTAVTAGFLNFDGSQPWTIAGTGAVTLATLSGPAGLTVTDLSGAGAHVISAPVTVAADVRAEVTAGTSLALTGTVAGTSTRKLIKAGGGTLSLPGGQWAEVAVQEGTLAVRPGRSVLSAGRLTLSGSATIDLADNDLIAGYTAGSVLGTMQGWLMAGIEGTPGVPRILTRESATGTYSGRSTTLALFDNALPQLTSWKGVAVGTNVVIGKYTFFGDANLDGVVDGADYGVVDAFVGSTQTSWLFGDLNFDGITNDSDYSVVDAFIGAGLGEPLAAVTAGSAGAWARPTAGASPGLTAGATVVPEPGWVGAWLIPGLAALIRRRGKGVL